MRTGRLKMMLVLEPYIIYRCSSVDSGCLCERENVWSSEQSYSCSYLTSLWLPQVVSGRTTSS